MIINAANTPGLAASLKSKLEKEGLEVAKIGSDFETTQNRTVVHKRGLCKFKLATTQAGHNDKPDMHTKSPLARVWI